MNRSKHNQFEWIPIQDKLNKEWKKQDAYKEKNKKAKNRNTIRGYRPKFSIKKTSPFQVKKN